MKSPPIASGADPAQPWRNRRPIRLFWLGAFAQATVNAAKRVLHVWYSGSRPYISDNGAISNGPAANPSRYIETVRDPSSTLVVWNSAMNCGIPVARMEDPRGLAVQTFSAHSVRKV